MAADAPIADAVHKGAKAWDVTNDFVVVSVRSTRCSLLTNGCQYEGSGNKEPLGRTCRTLASEGKRVRRASCTRGFIAIVAAVASAKNSGSPHSAQCSRDRGQRRAATTCACTEDEAFGESRHWRRRLEAPPSGYSREMMSQGKSPEWFSCRQWTAPRIEAAPMSMCEQAHEVSPFVAFGSMMQDETVCCVADVNLVGFSIGTSAGLTPLSSLPTRSAARRHLGDKPAASTSSASPSGL
jgi:hypothetical protein